jgi:hypothetical protein
VSTSLTRLFPGHPGLSWNFQRQSFNRRRPLRSFNELVTDYQISSFLQRFDMHRLFTKSRLLKTCEQRKSARQINAILISAW